MKTTKNRECNFNLPKYSILVSKNSVDALRKLEPIGKITLFVIPQG